MARRGIAFTPARLMWDNAVWGPSANGAEKGIKTGDEDLARKMLRVKVVKGAGDAGIRGHAFCLYIGFGGAKAGAKTAKRRHTVSLRGYCRT